MSLRWIKEVVRVAVFNFAGVGKDEEVEEDESQDREES